MSALLFLLRNLNHLKARFYLLIVFGILDGAILFSVPLLISVFLRSDLDLERAQTLLIYVTIAITISINFQYWIRKKGESLAPELANHLRRKIILRLESLPVEWISENHSGRILSLSNQLSDGIGSLASETIWIVGHAWITLILFFFMTARESFAVAITNGLLLTLFMLVSVCLALKISKLSAIEGQTRAALSERFADCIANLRTIKMLSLQSFIHKIMDDAIHNHNTAVGKLQSFHARRWSILHSLFYLSFIITLFCLLSGIAGGLIASSMMVIFISAFTSVRGYIERLSELVKHLMELRAFLDNAADFLPESSKIIELSGELADWNIIQVKDLYFSYSEDNPGFSIPSFSFKKGDIISIRGESGQGKTTFLMLLAGLLKPIRGTIAIDGRAYTELPKGYPTSIMTCISQATELFNLSIRENLTLNTEVSDDKIFSLLTELGLGDWITSLPLGIQTLVGEKGLQISSGQKQRLCIARAILQEREIMLLDEPSSNLDLESERLVVSCLAKHLKNRSAIIVSHRDVFRSITKFELSFAGGRLDVEGENIIGKS
jgi:ABC-type multidrug transport system fused ATPase/permease subunit